jgi:hypothetical protein
MNQYPLFFHIENKLLCKNITVTDASGNTVAFISRSKVAVFSDITLYSNELKETALLQIKPEKLWNIDHTFSFHAADNQQHIGTLSRKFITSALWRARYEMKNPEGKIDFVITEENPWERIAVSVLNKIKRGKYVSKYFLKPTYQILDNNEKVLGEIKEKQQIFKREFKFNLSETQTKNNEIAILAAVLLLMLVDKV